MGGRFRNQAVLAVFAAAFVLAAGGGAAQASGTTGIDLSTDQAVYDHLRSLGIDPTGVVIQRGMLNYAGPSCPGVLWNCTTATKVAQIGAGGGENKAECEPEEDQVAPPTGTQGDVVCAILQVEPSGQNHARCVQRVTDSAAAKLFCKITQTSATGGNHALVHQVIVQKEGPVQLADEEAYVTQTTGTGHNQVQVNQDISQFTGEANDPDALPTTFEQDQTGTFDADIDQNANGGQNTCHLTQSLTQDGRAKGSVDQRQAGNQTGEVDQNSVGEGDGEGDGGGVGVTVQSSEEGHSECTAHQRERKTLVGEGNQQQIGPQDCCATQIGPGTIHIHQDSFARASQPTAFQDLTTNGRFASENGLIVHHLKINDDAITAHADGGLLLSDCTTAVGCVSTTDPDAPDDDDDIILLLDTVPAEELADW